MQPRLKAEELFFKIFLQKQSNKIQSLLYIRSCDYSKHR